MMLSWLALASLVFTDPAGDANGTGTLTPPTAAVYADLGELDLREVQVTTGSPAYVRLRLASVSNAANLPDGITLPVADVYFDLAPGGETQSLPGPSLRFAETDAWEWAVRVHGDGSTGVTHEGEPFGVTMQVEGDDVWLRINRSLDRLPRGVTVLVGLYDPFARDNWRGLQSQASAWSFSGPSDVPPVMDLLAPNADAQSRALVQREAYMAGSSRGQRVWWGVTWAGLILFAVSVMLRIWKPGWVHPRKARALPLLDEDDLVGTHTAPDHH